MQLPQNPTLTDGVIFLRPLTMEDAAAHLAGEDDEMVRWLNGGHSTPETVQAFIERSQESWRTGGPRRPFGILPAGSPQVSYGPQSNAGRDEAGQPSSRNETLDDQHL